MMIWVDGDSCARGAMDVLLNCAQQRGLDVHVVADRPIPAAQVSWVSMSVVSGGKDAADDFISSRACSGDIAITRDFTLGIRLIGSGVTVMNDSGNIWKLRDLKAREEEAELMLAIRRGGIARKSPMHYSSEASSKFESSLLRLIDGM
ncbi:hypothetical protein S1OALGB6SA_1477 [Olavius algarvensis spirochete endosymbiont]|uniref:DUF188 domain-containing protein n=1 Tax=Olavius algarvensis spirochete endosymbiont TaxID=260710 RepID=UPI00052DE381|nr:DUF188 domain-containing protein [Olavius algarvensis spirochete endosymbiont]KGM43528.1 hypothetical protein JY97_06695 [Alkalispirochaeta odontotermitis]CAD7842521.1 MAG: hypothetical protein [Olavius algarvensis spirochete endosymbiont]VDB00399.1 hypothetical protein S1OALGB6SA_1477 [Olavius algarvensis spirochete endosymbiont]